MIRPEAIRMFADHVVRENKWAINPQLVVDYFVQFYYGYLFNQNIKSIVGLAVTVRGDDFPLGVFQTYITMEELNRPRGDFTLQVTAYGPNQNEVQSTPDDLYMRLNDGAELYIKFDQSMVAKPTPVEGESEAKPRNDRDRRGTHSVRDELTEHDINVLHSVSMIASSKLIEYLSLGGRAARKDLPEVAYRLGCTSRVIAAVKVINTQFMGEQGEDILVKNLLTGKTQPAFSSDFGTNKEWMLSIKGDARRAEFEYNDEEKDVFDEYARVLSQVK
jgi:hypothetical protein